MSDLQKKVNYVELYFTHTCTLFHNGLCKKLTTEINVSVHESDILLKCLEDGLEFKFELYKFQTVYDSYNSCDAYEMSLSKI